MIDDAPYEVVVGDVPAYANPTDLLARSRRRSSSCRRPSVSP
jgi:hypothetical protein